MTTYADLLAERLAAIQAIADAKARYKRAIDALSAAKAARANPLSLSAVEIAERKRLGVPLGATLSDAK